MKTKFLHFIRPLTISLGVLLALAFLLAFGGAVTLAHPTLSAVYPAPNEHTVPATGAVSLTYDKEMDPTTANRDKFAVYAMPSGLLSEAYRVQDRQIELTASSPFKPGELVHVSATTSTLSLNGGFEEGLEQWGYSSDVEVISPGRTGNYAVRSFQERTTAQSAGWIGVRQEMEVLPGQTYDYAIWLKSENLAGGHLKFVWKNASDDVLRASYPVRGLSGDLNDWTEFHGQVAAPLGASKAEIVIWHGVAEGKNHPGSTLWIDDMTVTPIECTTDQLCNAGFEEGTNGWSFSGTTELLSPGYSGEYALSSTQTKGISDTMGWVGIAQYVQVAADQRYEFTAWLNTEHATNTHLKVEWFDLAGQVLNTTYLDKAPENSIGWAKEGGEVTAPANASMARIVIWHGVQNNKTNVPGSQLLIDDVTFAIPPDSYSVSLVPGWNLVSIPLHPDNTQIADALTSIDGNYDLVYAFDCSAESWKIYDPSSPPFANTLAHIDEKMGVWIKMTAADTLVVHGSQPNSTTIALCTEWSLVGYPSGQNRDVSDALNPIAGAYTLTYAYDAANGSWKKFDPNDPPFANSLDQMQPGWGYWIKANQDTNWTIAN